MYATDVNAYGQEINAKAKRSDILYQQFTSKLESNRFILDKHKVQVDTDNAKSQLYALTIDKLVNVFRDRIANFSAHVGEVQQYIGTKMDSQKLNLDSAIQDNNAQIAKARHQLDQFSTVNSMRGQYALAGAQIYTGLIAAVLNSIQTLVAQTETVSEE
jgi:hypothetical protein